jgi:hypothetical protein
MRGPRQNSVEYGQNLSQIKLSVETRKLFMKSFESKVDFEESEIIHKTIVWLKDVRGSKSYIEKGEVKDFYMGWHVYSGFMNIFKCHGDIASKLMHSILEDVVNSTNNKEPFISGRFDEFFTVDGKIKIRVLGKHAWRDHTEYRGGIDPNKKIKIAPENIIDINKIFKGIADNVPEDVMKYCGENDDSLLLRYIKIKLQENKVGGGTFNVDEVLKLIKTRYLNQNK